MFKGTVNGVARDGELVNVTIDVTVTTADNEEYEFPVVHTVELSKAGAFGIGAELEWGPPKKKRKPRAKKGE